MHISRRLVFITLLSLGAGVASHGWSDVPRPSMARPGESVLSTAPFEGSRGWISSWAVPHVNPWARPAGNQFRARQEPASSPPGLPRAALASRATIRPTPAERWGASAAYAVASMRLDSPLRVSPARAPPSLLVAAASGAV